MPEYVRRNNSMIGLLLILIVAIVLGVLLSDFVLSLSPLAAIGVIFGVSVTIIATVELWAYFRRMPRDPRGHYEDVYRRERKRRAHRTKRSGKSHGSSEEELIDQEFATPVEPL